MWSQHLCQTSIDYKNRITTCISNPSQWSLYMFLYSNHTVSVTIAFKSIFKVTKWLLYSFFTQDCFEFSVSFMVGFIRTLGLVFLFSKISHWDLVKNSTDAFNPSTQEAEAGGFLSSSPAWSTKWVPGQPGLHRETVSRERKTKNKNKNKQKTNKQKDCEAVWYCKGSGSTCPTSPPPPQSAPR